MSENRSDKVNNILNDFLSCIIDDVSNDIKLKYDFNRLDMFNQLEIMKSNRQNEFIEVNKKYKNILSGSDFHGDLIALISIIKNYIEILKKDNNAALVLTGDYLDRGSNSLLCLALIVRLYNANLENVYILKGNHETAKYSNLISENRVHEDDNFKYINDKLRLSLLSLPLILILNTNSKRIAFSHSLIPLRVINTYDYRAPFSNTRCNNYDTYTILWSDLDITNTNRAIVYDEGRFRLGLMHILGTMLLNNIDLLIRGHQAGFLSQTHKSLCLEAEDVLKNFKECYSQLEHKEDFENDVMISSIKSDIFITREHIKNYTENINKIFDIKADFLENFNKNLSKESSQAEEYKKIIEEYDSNIREYESKRDQKVKELEDYNKQLNQTLNNNKNMNFNKYLSINIDDINDNTFRDKTGKLITEQIVGSNKEIFDRANSVKYDEKLSLDVVLNINLDSSLESPHKYVIEDFQHYIITSHANRDYAGCILHITDNHVKELYL